VENTKPAARLERDSLGEIEVPAGHLWGAQTQRCLLNFPIGAGRYHWGRPVIRALGIVKKCAALANEKLGQLPREKVELIVQAADEVIDGRWDDEFPLVVFQTGSGTQSNMNANEVISYRANQLGRDGSHTIHPNDDTNRSQSSNDVFPSVMHIAAVEQIEDLLFPATDVLRDALSAKMDAFSGVVMMGRTHLQDAAPVTLGQVISGWLAQLDFANAGIRGAMPGVSELALGGTAVGTGLNATPGFGELAASEISRESGKRFSSAGNKFAALSAHDAMVTLSGALRTLAGALFKIANDLRWYASGPRTGIGELCLPPNEPGSSIMPGKINPTQCEALMQAAVQVFGNDHAVAFAGTQGNFQLNTFKPVILHNVLDSILLLAEGCRAFEEHCVRGFQPNAKIMRDHLESSLVGATALSPHIGYEKAAQISLAAQREGIGLREAALKSGFVTDRQFEAWVDFEAMTHPLDE
jgi:fumarate hydratase class II